MNFTSAMSEPTGDIEAVLDLLEAHELQKRVLGASQLPGLVRGNKCERQKGPRVLPRMVALLRSAEHRPEEKAAVLSAIEAMCIDGDVARALSESDELVAALTAEDDDMRVSSNEKSLAGRCLEARR